MPVERIDLSTITPAEYQRIRGQLITGTTISATRLINCHPDVTPLALHHHLAGTIPLPNKDSGPKRRGRIYQPAVAAALAEERPGLKIEPANCVLIDRERGIGGSPDTWIHDGDLFLVGELKTAKRRVFDRDYADDSAPLRHVLQTLWYVYLADADAGLLVVLCHDPDNPELKIIEVPRHEPTIAKMLEAAEDCWRYVREGREPEITLGADREMLGRIFAREVEGNTINLAGDNELISALHERANLKDQMRKADARCKKIETMVMARLGVAERATGVDEFRITWKTEHRDEYTVAARDTRVLRILDRRDDD